LIGAIASFIFKTAGEVISFLGKNAWLLVVAVVVYAVEQFKSKNKKKKYIWTNITESIHQRINLKTSDYMPPIIYQIWKKN